MPTMSRSRRRQAGQALVVMVVAVIPALAMVGLIVDGGNAWAQQRNAQNGADAASEAGATVLGQRISNTDPSLQGPYWDGQVASKVAATAADNDITVPDAYYTDICGALLTPSGARATGFGDAAQVGAGDLPAGSGPPPSPCTPSGAVGPVAGVTAIGEKTFDTFFARIVGINTYTANTQATAVAGYLQQTCGGSPGGNCILLPVAFFYNLVACDKSGNAVDSGTSYQLFMNRDIVLPICKAASGNVGWLDWTSGGGGTAELVDCVNRAGGSDPCRPSITTPSWWPIAQAGGTSSQPLETALNQYDGQVVLLPVFDLMCHSTPGDPSGPNFGCADPCALSDKGCNPNWYHLQPFAAFQLTHAYTNGNPVAECNPSWSDPDPAYKTTNCLIGDYVDYTIGGLGTVGPGPSGSGGGVIGVQLIK